MGSVRVDPAALLAQAARVEAIRAAVNPSDLPVAYSPPGADAGSAARASAISAGAAHAANGLWSSWSALGRVAETLRANAAGYSQRDEASAAVLAGGGSGGGPPAASVPISPPAAPVTVGQSHAAMPAGTPEILAAQLRAGAGASSAEQFASVWRLRAGQLASAAADLAGVRSALSSDWSGTAHDGAQSDLAVVHADLSDHQDRMQRVSGRADTHALDYRQVDDTMPTPQQYQQWHNNLQQAVAADQAYPGVYTGAVLQAQQDLAGGYSTSEQAYGQYTVDPVTGDLIDSVTGEHFDPVTGEPVEDAYADDAAAEDALSSMGPQLLTGLLGGAAGAVAGAVGAVTQGGQQLAQMATQGVSQFAKSVSAQGGVGEGNGSDPGELGLGSGDFSGGGGGGSGGGGGDVPAAPMIASAVGAAPGAPSGVTTGGLGPTTRLGGAAAGMGLGGMGAPMMPMGGAGASPAADSKAGASGDGKKFAAAQMANTQKVIGQAETERIASKREARERRLDEVKAKALAASEEAQKS